MHFSPPILVRRTSFSMALARSSSLIRRYSSLTTAKEIQRDHNADGIVAPILRTSFNPHPRYSVIRIAHSAERTLQLLITGRHEHAVELALVCAPALFLASLIQFLSGFA